MIPEGSSLPAPPSTERPIQRFQSLGRAMACVQEALAPDDVLSAVDAQLRAMGLEWHFSLLDETGTELVIRHTSLTPPTLNMVERLLGSRVVGSRLALDRTAGLRAAVRERQAVLAAGKTAFGEVFPEAPATVLGEVVDLIGAPSLIVAPLLTRGTVIGVLTLWAGDLGADDLPAVAIFAQQVATAHENARLFQQAQRRLERTRALQAEHQRLAIIIGQMAEGVLVMDADQRIVLANGAALAILGDPPGAALQGSDGVACLGLIRPDGGPCPAEETPMYRALRQAEVFRSLPAAITRADGQRRELSMSLAPIRDEHGLVIGVVNVFRDVTDERALEHAKDVFLSIAAHELRTPVTALKGYAYLLLRGLRREARPLDREQASALVERMSQQVDRLALLSENLLDVSRLGVGQLKLALEPVDVVATGRDLLERLQLTAPAHELSLRAGNPEIVARADTTRLEQVLRSLVGNAIKYSPDGGPVQVAVQVVDETVEVQVCDRGIGIPPERLAGIFEPFSLAEAVATRRPGGLGLGLYISKGLVEAQGGTMRVASRPGVGTTFTFTLPLWREGRTGATEPVDRAGGPPA